MADACPKDRLGSRRGDGIPSGWIRQQVRRSRRCTRASTRPSFGIVARPGFRTARGRGIVRGDGIINFDVSLAKNVALGGARTLQLRVEAFNAFNHPNFGLPGHTFGAPNFGVVSSASEGRTIQLGVRFVY